MEDYEKSCLEKAQRILFDVLDSISKNITSGSKILDIAEGIEQKIIELGGMWAFPVNIAIGNIAAHYTPLMGENTVIPEDEIVKIDLGVCVDGYILDKAFSLYLGEDTDKKALIETANEALEVALKNIKANEPIANVASAVHDFVKSRGFKVISNLHGHKIERWKLHTDKEVPIDPSINVEGTFKEGEIYAIEVFVTNGEGFAYPSDDVRIYSLPSVFAEVSGRLKLPIHLRDVREVFFWLFKNRKALPVSIRHLNKVFDNTTVRIALSILDQNGLLIKYPVLKERSGSVAQSEETILVKKEEIEILTRKL
ncbi:MAG: type II methionyl aminopeptidase [Crenarchaeota archaeon]|nr:type II methionyl aminopeptidase [Thermoproteota archaeon]MCR8453563.1 type II methionyl aminopeptidase [Thermoproteota archaeon]MCR8454794.1 type II methionyl aminopeptidase [Thermoproteota archaeon]MCR8462686.1 type II methionyl aminopeptidase [Thermoproteota archaeon]MCR8470305.1 type II methionyl aminopeptidase [Thermoproteota archaeon]